MLVHLGIYNISIDCAHDFLLIMFSGKKFWNKITTITRKINQEKKK